MINCAVIGIGRMGQQHVRVLNRLKGVRLVAVCDQKFTSSGYTDYRLMFKQEKIDAVIIATPTSTHFAICRDCLKANKHVLVEKPLTNNLRQAKALFALAKKKNLILTVGLIERFNPAVRRLKQLINQGKLGKVKSIICQRVGLFDPRIKDVNVVEDIAIHDLDIAGYLLDSRPKKICAFGGRAILTNRIDYADILLDYGSASVHLQVNWITPIKIRRLLLSATNGYAELDYIKQTLIYYKNYYSPAYADFQQLIKKSRRHPQIIKIQKQEPLKLELKSFLQAIKTPRQPEVTGQEALTALQIVLKISKIIKR